MQCGETDNLEFDHEDPLTRSYTLMNAPKDKFEEELAKIQLLCFVCHTKKTGEDKITVLNVPRRTLSPEHKAKMAEGLARWKAENREHPMPKADPCLGDAYVDREAPKRLAATGVQVGDQIRVTQGKHKGEIHTVEQVKPSEAEVFDGRRWWSAWHQPPYFEVVR